MYIDAYSSRCKIFKSIPSGSKVLVVGCGSGVIANLLSIWKKCRVYCVDKNTRMSGIAKNKCAEILTMDIETPGLPYENGYFDVIILGNVLEHLKEPTLVLTSLKKYLSENGFII